MKIPGVPLQLDGSMVIKACATEDEILRVAQLNRQIHGGAEGDAVRDWLIKGHPQIVPEGWLYVEDVRTGAAVATLCLMPLTWRYGSATLPVAELGFVATLPGYRRRGLQRSLSAVFDRIALANKMTVAAIEGIPYFYRQFGYEYALPLTDSRFDLGLDEIPFEESASHVIRPARPADIPQLMAFYEDQASQLDITTERSEAMWHHYLGQPPGATFGLQLYAITSEGAMVGYMAVAPSGWVNRLNVVELATRDQTAIQGALAFARARAEKGSFDALGLQLPANHAAAELARSMGIQEGKPYGWQLKILDPVAFLNTIAPALEARLAASPLAGSGGELKIELYRHQVELHLDGGQISASILESGKKADLALPPQAATQLWFGWRSMAELDDWYKDAWAKPEKHDLINILFPAVQAHIYLGY